jgi:hypothetical protein
MSSFDDDDIPLAVVKAKAASSASNDNADRRSTAPGVKDVKKVASTTGKDSKSKVATKVSGKDSPVAGRDSKKESKDLKRAKSSSEWADIDNSLRYSSKKSKSWFDWARANTPLVIFLGLVLIIISCR